MPVKQRKITVKLPQRGQILTGKQMLVLSVEMKGRINYHYTVWTTLIDRNPSIIELDRSIEIWTVMQ